MAVNYDVVKDAPITPINARAISVNGSPLDVVGETVADIVLGDLTVNQRFFVVKNLTVACCWEQIFWKHMVPSWIVAITLYHLELITGVQFRYHLLSSLHYHTVSYLKL